MSRDPRSPSASALPVLTPPDANAPAAPILRLRDLTELLLTIQVPLDRISLTLREVLELRVGSVVELEKVTGETFEVTANGTPVAKGEIRVQGERFALRVTEVLRTARREDAEGEGARAGESGP